MFSSFSFLHWHDKYLRSLDGRRKNAEKARFSAAPASAGEERVPETEQGDENDKNCCYRIVKRRLRVTCSMPMHCALYSPSPLFNNGSTNFSFMKLFFMLKTLSFDKILTLLSSLLVHFFFTWICLFISLPLIYLFDTSAARAAMCGAASRSLSVLLAFCLSL